MRVFTTLLAAALLAAALGSATLPARADVATIVVNGSTVNFDQPPIERGGRVFVPLRGVFERLGASVVYANGQINATGNGRTITLHIGSNQAFVNGAPVRVDVAPFLVGARTLVPLRFVAQSLGATVNYNDGNRVVTIPGNGNASVPAAAPPAANFIRVTAPSPGAKVGADFTLSGVTRAGSTVAIAATGRALVGGVVPVGSGTFQNSTIADANGVFSVAVHIIPIPGGTAHITIRSTSPSGVVHVRNVTYPT
ncbi:MAG: hypothetical protein NVS1B14_11730 [Vulcanimicrobiaceae bacterium]